MAFLEKLLAKSSAPIGEICEFTDPSFLLKQGKLGQSLLNLLTLRNGFCAFESALYVFPHSSNRHISLYEWNQSNLWRNEYGQLGRDFLFFAQDAFANQYCLRDKQIWLFEVETGESNTITDSLEGWAKHILDNYKVLTGYPLLHEWQLLNGAINVGKRLLPKIPFVLGGKYTVDNLVDCNSVSVMKTMGNLAIQINDLPDGSKIEFKIID